MVVARCNKEEVTLSAKALRRCNLLIWYAVQEVVLLALLVCGGAAG